MCKTLVTSGRAGPVNTRAQAQVPNKPNVVFIVVHLQ